MRGCASGWWQGAALVAGLSAGLGGCWRTDPVTLDVDRVAFQPASGDGPAGWSVVRAEAPLPCPDGAAATVWVARPDAPTGPMPAVLWLHSGAFDYELEPDLSAPLTSATWQEPTRMSASWASTRVLASFGLAALDDPYEASTGALAATLAGHGAALVAPANCYGDYWHSASELSPNDPAEGVAREGRALADWGWRLVAEPGFAAAEGVDLGFEPAAGAPGMVGVAEGARGVGELIAGGRAASAVLVDGPLDDVRPYVAAADLWAEEAAGVARLWPGTDPVPGTLAAAANLPVARTGVVYSSVEPSVPAGMQAAIVARVTPGGGWVLDTGATGRAQLSANASLAAQAADWMFPASP